MVRERDPLPVALTLLFHRPERPSLDLSIRLAAHAEASTPAVRRSNTKHHSARTTAPTPLQSCASRMK
jgi:hypothetical protein